MIPLILAPFIVKDILQKYQNQNQTDSEDSDDIDSEALENLPSIGGMTQINSTMLKRTPSQIVFVGGPGSGKNTQLQKILQKRQKMQLQKQESFERNIEKDSYYIILQKQKSLNVRKEEQKQELESKNIKNQKEDYDQLEQTPLMFRKQSSIKYQDKYLILNYDKFKDFQKKVQLLPENEKPIIIHLKSSTENMLKRSKEKCGNCQSEKEINQNIQVFQKESEFQLEEFKNYGGQVITVDADKDEDFIHDDIMRQIEQMEQNTIGIISLEKQDSIKFHQKMDFNGIFDSQ